MKARMYTLFVLFTFLFLFYPGDSYLFHIFAFNRDVFQQTEKIIRPKIHPVPFVTNETSPYTTAQGIYIVDSPSFTPILEKNSRSKFLPASTTKVITALVAYDIYKLTQIIAVKNVKVEGQVMGLVQGEKISVENLLYGLLVHSGNDAAYALANDYGYDRFIQRMNAKAQELYMKDSVFKNPAGFDEADQYSTPFDLCLAARAVLQNEYLAKIVSTKEIIISDVDYQYFHKLTNVNKLLGEIQGVGGLKTGYTENAGENLISFYKKNGHEFIIVILKSTDRFADTRNIITWITSSVDYATYSIR